MKVRIKSYNGELENLTLGKEYEITRFRADEAGFSGYIDNDVGNPAFIIQHHCVYLSDGEWELVEDSPKVVIAPQEVTPQEKPPLGVMPHALWMEERILAVSDCIAREAKAGIYNAKRVVELKWLMDWRGEFA